MNVEASACDGVTVSSRRCIQGHVWDLIGCLSPETWFKKTCAVILVSFLWWYFHSRKVRPGNCGVEVSKDPREWLESCVSFFLWTSLYSTLFWPRSSTDLHHVVVRLKTATCDVALIVELRKRLESRMPLNIIVSLQMIQSCNFPTWTVVRYVTSLASVYVTFTCQDSCWREAEVSRVLIWKRMSGHILDLMDDTSRCIESRES